MIDHGTIIDDKYEIISMLGAGGFGNVYKAMHKQFGRVVAIKVLKTTLLDESDGLLRFEREAKSINAIKHKNIISLYGYGIWQNAPYMVMEFIEGKSLDDTLELQDKLEPEVVLALMTQLFAGLACAHASGVVHRDLKPSNIMLIPSSDRASSVKIIDFGLAKLMPGYGVGSQKLTETGYALGTCHYMAPEQCLGGTIDQRADIYSAGCIFYQCLTGKLPFDADDNVSVMFRHINDQPIPISEQLENTPMSKALQNVLDNCMAKDPDDRYTKADEVRADIERVISGDLTRIKRFSAAQVPSLAKRSSRHNLWTVAVIALTGVALLGFFSLFNSWRGASSLRRDSNELAIDLFRKWDSKAPNTSAWTPGMEAIVKVDAMDHKLTPQQRLKVAQWLAHGYLNSSDKRKRDGQIERALTIRTSIAPRLRVPSDELLFARTLNVENRPDLAVSVLLDLHRNRDDYPNARWEFERARILLAEILIFHGHLDIAEKNLQEQMRSVVTSKAEVHYRFLLGDINMLRKNYDAALKIYEDEKDLPHSLGAADWAALARVAIYKNQNAMAKSYLKNSEQMCKEEFPPGPCETIVLLETTLAANQHDHEAAKKLLSSFRDAKQISSAFTVHFRNSDRQLCVEALRAAGYNDLINFLGFYAIPNNTPAGPLDTTSIN